MSMVITSTPLIASITPIISMLMLVMVLMLLMLVFMFIAVLMFMFVTALMVMFATVLMLPTMSMARLAVIDVMTWLGSWRFTFDMADKRF